MQGTGCSSGPRGSLWNSRCHTESPTLLHWAGSQQLQGHGRARPTTIDIYDVHSRIPSMYLAGLHPPTASVLCNNHPIASRVTTPHTVQSSMRVTPMHTRDRSFGRTNARFLASYRPSGQRYPRCCRRECVPPVAFSWHQMPPHRAAGGTGCAVCLDGGRSSLPQLRWLHSAFQTLDVIKRILPGRSRLFLQRQSWHGALVTRRWTVTHSSR